MKWKFESSGSIFLKKTTAFSCDTLLRVILVFAICNRFVNVVHQIQMFQAFVDLGLTKIINRKKVKARKIKKVAADIQFTAFCGNKYLNKFHFKQVFVMVAFRSTTLWFSPTNMLQQSLLVKTLWFSIQASKSYVRVELDPFKNILPSSYVMKHNKIIKICQLQSSLFLI